VAAFFLDVRASLDADQTAAFNYRFLRLELPVRFRTNESTRTSRAIEGGEVVQEHSGAKLAEGISTLFERHRRPVSHELDAVTTTRARPSTVTSTTASACGLFGSVEVAN
jgi:hypothetical protein